MKTYIHVNQHIIKSNRSKGERLPELTVKTYKTNDYCHEVVVDGPCKVIYRPGSPLSCGAEVWIETESEVQLVKHVNGIDGGNASNTADDLQCVSR
jgi:hypothetical protein